MTRYAKEVPGLNVSLGGPAAANYEINAEVQKDLPKLGAISLPLLAILLVLVFRSLVAAALPLVIGAISVLGAFSLVRLLSNFTEVSIFAANIISLLGLGLAIDYSLLYVSRFRDELIAGQSVPSAIEIASGTAGEAIFLSGSTVALSLLGMLAFPEMFLRSMGLGGALAVVVAMASSLTILPAILSVLGSNVDKLAVPFLPNKLGFANNSRGWRTLGKFVVRWPIPVLVFTLGLLIAAGVPFLHVKFANPGVESLPASFSARQVATSLSNKFGSSQNPPISVLLTLPDSPITAGGIAESKSFYTRLTNLSGVKSVGGFPSAILTVPNDYAASLLSGDASMLMPSDNYPQIVQLVNHYVSGNTTLMTVSYVGDSDSRSTQALVKAIRSLPVSAGARVLVGGDPAELVDRLESLKKHMPGALYIIFVATFVVLFVMLSSIVIPIKAIVLNTLSLSAAFGLMTWIFQEGHLQRLLHFTSSRSLDPTLPVLIFAIAFGLATDYEVFLVSRIKEEYLRSGSNTEAVVLGVEKTGGIITSAGLLLVVVVAAFGMSDILSMKEMGVGLAIAVAVDAAIVRTLLVPAAMQLFDRLNWWLPWRKKIKL
jgi:uncharacterized membrane protein YdfJ with MMPL/SSD domain